MSDRLFSEPATILSVSQLNRIAREVLEGSFPLFWVAGEVSNLTRASSGHWYFSLKDNKAQVRCVMFRNKNISLDWQPREGDHVEARALVTLYEARGDFQLNIEVLQQAGLGALFEAFERLKAKLGREGLFDVARKRPLPEHPRQIGIVTSLDAAALRDVLTTLNRRMPTIPVVIYPTPVQGKGAAGLIGQAIRTASARAECDVLIVCRGGGSMEDLWQFNEEVVARAIADCTIPVVSGVGHETDFTIADFVADWRAPTPTGAAEMVSPDRMTLLHRITQLQLQSQRQMRYTLYQRMQQLDYLARRLMHPGERLRQQQERFGHLQARLNAAIQRTLVLADVRFQPLSQRLVATQARHLDMLQERLRRLEQNLRHLGPQAVLDRGYALVQTERGEIIRSSSELLLDQKLHLSFAHGLADARVTNIKS
jgi:exodeoxyribonuclease VII large subunit